MISTIHSFVIVGTAAQLTSSHRATFFGAILFICLLAKIFLAPLPVMATSVVALIDKTNDRIVMAADCHVRRDVASSSDCKIIDEPGCTVAIAGLYSEKRERK